MILVVTGTHPQPFDRLVRAAEELALTGRRVVVQAGTSTVPTPHCERYAFVDHEGIEGLADEASVIVAHGGPGSLGLAWDRGLVPVAVPRKRALGEHVDDHQVQFCGHLEDRAVVVLDTARLPQALMQVADVLGTGPRGAEDAFVDAFDTLARDVVDRVPSRSTLRDRVRILISLLGSGRR